MPTYNAVVSGDEEGVAPYPIETTDLAVFKMELYNALIKAHCGWCHIFIDGKQAMLSKPAQVFKMKMADGTVVDITDTVAEAGIVFNPQGRFECMR